MAARATRASPRCTARWSWASTMSTRRPAITTARRCWAWRCARPASPFSPPSSAAGPSRSTPGTRTPCAAPFEKSLALLGRDQIDILMIHEPDRPGQYDWWTDWERFHGPVNELLDELKAEGDRPLHRPGRHHRLRAAAHHRHGRYDVVLTAFNYQPALARGRRSRCCPRPGGRAWASSSARRCSRARWRERYDDEVARGARWLSPRDGAAVPGALRAAGRAQACPWPSWRCAW